MSSSFSAFEALESLVRQRHQRSFEHLRRIARHQMRGATNPNKLLPSAELTENQECIRVMVDLPGAFAKDIDVTIEPGGVLCILGARKIMDVDNAVCLKKQKFIRRYALDTDVVDVANATAVLQNGVLTFSASKNKTRPKTIRIPVIEMQTSTSDGLPSADQEPNNQAPTTATLKSEPEETKYSNSLKTMGTPLTCEDDSTEVETQSGTEKMALVGSGRVCSSN